MPGEVLEADAAHQLDLLVMAEDVRHRAGPGRLTMIALAATFLVGRQVDSLADGREQISIVRAGERTKNLPASYLRLPAHHLDLGQPVPGLGPGILHGPHVLEGPDHFHRGGGNHDPVPLGQPGHPLVVLGH